MKKTFERWCILFRNEPVTVGADEETAWFRLAKLTKPEKDRRSLEPTILELKKNGYRAVRCKIIIEDINDHREKDD